MPDPGKMRGCVPCNPPANCINHSAAWQCSPVNSPGARIATSPHILRRRAKLGSSEWCTGLSERVGAFWIHDQRDRRGSPHLQTRELRLSSAKTAISRSLLTARSVETLDETGKDLRRCTRAPRNPAGDRLRLAAPVRKAFGRDRSWRNGRFRMSTLLVLSGLSPFTSSYRKDLAGMAGLRVESPKPRNLAEQQNETEQL